MSDYDRGMFIVNDFNRYLGAKRDGGLKMSVFDEIGNQISSIGSVFDGNLIELKLKNGTSRIIHHSNFDLTIKFV
ncbi:hypothetical protein ACYSNR_04310 [Enterococcus sp. LJL128]